MISDRWTGLDEIFTLGREVAIAEDGREVATPLARIPRSDGTRRIPVTAGPAWRLSLLAWFHWSE